MKKNMQSFSTNSIHYDKKYDILYFVLKSGPADYVEEISDGVTVEYNEKGKPIGIEVFKASELLGKKFTGKSLSGSSVSA